MFECDKETLGLDDTLLLEKVLQALSEEDKLLLVAVYVHRIPIQILAEHYKVSRRTIDKRIYRALQRARSALGVEVKSKSIEIRPETRLPRGLSYANGGRYVAAFVSIGRGRKKYLGRRPSTPEGIAELAELYRKAKESA